MLRPLLPEGGVRAGERRDACAGQFRCPCARAEGTRDSLRTPLTETYARSHITVQTRLADVAADFSVHTLYHHHSDEGGTLGPFDWNGHATNVLQVFEHGTGVGTYHWSAYSGRAITVKCYDMSDMKPRPERGIASYVPTSWSSVVMGPRELAVPLRYYCTRNLKSQRGRMYLGPFDMTFIEELVADDGPHLMTQVLDLGSAIGSIGGAQTSWVLYRPTKDPPNAPGAPGGTLSAAYLDITEIWVNDQWAHQESREHVEITRRTASITPGLP